jgi:O-acetyl-ADP-ribose deacetylase (regulator of RNase III)
VKLTATITDITTLEVDAIVNAANEQLADAYRQAGVEIS